MFVDNVHQVAYRLPPFREFRRDVLKFDESAFFPAAARPFRVAIAIELPAKQPPTPTR